MQGAKENQFRRAGIIDNRHCDLVFDLVIHIDGYEDDLAVLDNQTEMLKASLADFTYPTGPQWKDRFHQG